MTQDLGYGELWKSFNQQAEEENWSQEQREKIAKQIREGIIAEIEELADMGVLKR